MGVRQNPMPNSAVKLMEAYMDFSGGLNSEISNDRLKDSEFPILENVDLMGRGSAKRRYGRLEQAVNYPYDTASSVAQGMFPFYKTTQSSPDFIYAVNGNLYVQLAGQNTLTQIQITDNGNPFTFQSTLSVDAVQYQGTLWIATGTKLVELNYDSSTAWIASTAYAVGGKISSNGKVYLCTVAGTSGTIAPSHTSGTATDGGVTWTFVGTAPWTANTVIPYTPTTMEAIYIGTNGLATNPNSYVQDLNTATTATAYGIAPDKRVGWVQNPITLTGYYNAPAGWSIDYLWEYKKSTDSTWTQGQAYATGSAGKTWKFTPDTVTNYDFRLTVKQTGQAPTNSTTLTNYQVQSTAPASLLNTASMNKCRKILLHWDRILLTQDDTNPYQMYISDLLNPRFFPTTNTISFDFGKQEPITSLVRFRDMLVVFTKSTVQTLTGKSVADYKRSLIHDNLGCIADRTAKVVGNEIVFLSSEGLWKLKPNPFILEMMNVARMDIQIKSEIASLVSDTKACATTADGQYWICFPSVGKIYRYYYDNPMWVRDTSTVNGTNPLNFTQFLTFGDTVYNLTSTGRVYKHDKSVFTDGGDQFTMVVESKFLDLSASFNFKTLKKIHVLAKHYSDHNVNISTTVKADSTIVLNPESGQATIDPVLGVIWKDTITPNMIFKTGTSIGTWVLGDTPLGDIALSDQKANIRGKCKRVKVRFEHTDSKAAEIYGFGLEFKLKRP